MNVNEEDNAPIPDAEVRSPTTAAEEGEGAPTKPARRKRAVKAAVAEDGAVAAETSSEAAPVDEAATAVKAPRRRRAAVTTDSSAVEPVVEAIAPMPSETPAVTASAAEAPGATVQSTEPASAGDAEPIAAADAPQRDGEAQDGPRGRRRGRRERRRGRGGEGAAMAEGAAAANLASADDDDDGETSTGDTEPVEVIPPTDPNELFAEVLSGEFDVAVQVDAESPETAAPPKRVLRPDPEAPKLHKVLAQAGVGSRRDMEELILEGKISVNGQLAHIGQRISFGDHIKVDGRPVKVRIVPPPPRIIAYHKPAGEVVTHDDPQHRPTVFRRLPRLQQGKWQSVGRLDINTEGLLLFTNSGELANQLMHPRFGVEREYAVRVLGTLDEESKAELLEGVTIDGQPASFRSIEDGGGEGANHWYRVVITEGRNREVRRLFEEVGLTVSRLIRIRYGTVVLPRGLKRGVWVDLGSDDVRTIRGLAGGGRDERGGRGQQGQGNQGGRGKQRNERRNDRGPRDERSRPSEPSAVRAEPQQRDHDDPDFEEEIDHSRIPNPLEQTFDKRFVQNPRSPAGGRGFGRGGGGFGAGGSGNAPGGPKKGGGPREPDPMQTSVGYIGADAFHRKGGRGGNRGGGGGGGFGGGGGGFGGGGGGGGRRGGR